MDMHAEWLRFRGGGRRAEGGGVCGICRNSYTAQVLVGLSFSIVADSLGAVLFLSIHIFHSIIYFFGRGANTFYRCRAGVFTREHMPNLPTNIAPTNIA